MCHDIFLIVDMVHKSEIILGSSSRSMKFNEENPNVIDDVEVNMYLNEKHL